MIRRRAMTIIELLVVLSASMFVLTMSAKLIHQAMRSHGRTRSFFDLERTATRLSHRFREDVRQATSAVTADGELPNGVLLRLRLDASRVVEYGVLDGTLRRTLREGDNMLSLDDFAVGSGISCVVVRHESPPLVGLTIARDALDKSAARAISAREPPLRIHVEARLAGDLRHAAPRIPPEGTE